MRKNGVSLLLFCFVCYLSSFDFHGVLPLSFAFSRRIKLDNFRFRVADTQVIIIPNSVLFILTESPRYHQCYESSLWGGLGLYQPRDED